MGVGVLTYLALRQEPPLWVGPALLLRALAGGGLARHGSVARTTLAEGQSIRAPALAAGFSVGSVAAARNAMAGQSAALS
jgi:hypothetical protein